MAPQDKLVEVGLDDFALLDEVYGRNKKSAGSRGAATTTQSHDHYNRDDHNHNYKNPQQYVYRGVKVMTVRVLLEPVIDSNQAAQIYGGVSIVDYSIRKPVRGV